MYLYGRGRLEPPQHPVVGSDKRLEGCVGVPVQHCPSRTKPLQRRDAKPEGLRAVPAPELVRVEDADAVGVPEATGIGSWCVLFRCYDLERDQKERQLR